MTDQYDILIIAMDDQCNSSVDGIDIDTCTTKVEAQKIVKKAINDLMAGKYNYSLKGINYAYVTALPYDEDGNCLLGLVWSYASKFFKRVGEKWSIANT